MTSNRQTYSFLSISTYREMKTYAPHVYIRYVVVKSFIRLSIVPSIPLPTLHPLLSARRPHHGSRQSSSPQPLKSKKAVLCDLYDRHRSSARAVESHAESHQNHDLSHRDRTDFCCTSHGQSAPGPHLRLCVWVKYGPMKWEEFVTALQPIEIRTVH